MQQLVQEELVKLQQKGLLTLPKRFRQQLDLKDESIVKIKKEGRKLIIEPIVTLPYPVRTYTKEEIQEFINLDAKETKELKKKKIVK